ncbi:MAG: cobalamin-binding protein [Chloroflexi bacterium]|nr:MAG: cobalamin-binding protein [Chloroflexota bacterium]MBL1196711.1 cobalamin-binding protein [Chloroflexota bacterium]NOH14004.1 corrinoid protein [Chloroflexota bacterium]
MSVPESVHQRLTEAFIEGDVEVAEAITTEALEAGVDPLGIINEVMVPALTEVGNRFQTGEYFLPELMMAGEAAEKASKLLEDAIVASGQASEPLGTVVVGTVEGDVHDIGKNIVVTMLRAHGFNVVDLGRRVAPSAFTDAAKENNADIIGMSSLMTTTRPAIQNTVNLFEELGIRESYQLIAGGGSVTGDWATEIGIGYSEDAAGAVELCKQLMDAPSN